MAESDFSCSTAAESDDDTEEEDTGRVTARLSRRESVRKKPRTSSPAPRVSLPRSLNKVQAMSKRISKQLKGTDIDANLALRVLASAANMQKAHLEAKRKASQGNRKRAGSVPQPHIRETVCKAFCIAPRSYTNIMRSFLMDGCFCSSGKEMSGRSGNTKPKESRIPRNKSTRIMVRNFVRSRRLKRMRVAATQVLQHLESEKVVFIPKDDSGRCAKVPHHTAIRGTQRWLLEHGGHHRGK